jgi:hypothetical protein
MAEYFGQDEAMQRQQQSYRSRPRRTTDRAGQIVTLPPRTGKVLYMVPADCWMIGIVWADSVGVQWMDKTDFERTFGDEL